MELLLTSQWVHVWNHWSLTFLFYFIGLVAVSAMLPLAKQCAFEEPCVETIVGENVLTWPHVVSVLNWVAHIRVVYRFFFPFSAYEYLDNHNLCYQCWCFPFLISCLFSFFLFMGDCISSFWKFINTRVLFHRCSGNYFCARSLQSETNC